MSVKVMGLVWDERMSKDMKFVLLAYADHADHAGRNIYPSVETVAAKTGYDERSVQRITTKLEDAGYLVLDTGEKRKGGQGKSTHWCIPIKDDKLSPIQKGDKKNKIKPQRVTKRALKGDMVSPDPSLIKESEPSDSSSSHDETPPVSTWIQGEPVKASTETIKVKTLEIKPKTPYVLNSEKMEKVFSEARGCPLPDWEHNAKESNKRWRTPLNRILKLCDGNLEAACYLIREITLEMRKEHLTFDAPDQIVKTISSKIIDKKSKQVAYAEEH